jgi:hypothetical protein
MRFHPTSRTGKAGERRFESFVEEQLGFIYRGTKAPDIGIDGEIETCRRNGSSTGGLIKVQIKTIGRSPAHTGFRVAMDEAHLDYFASLTVPPVLALVCLEEDAIWWQPLLDKDEYVGPRGGYGIPFNLHRDRLTKRSGPALRLVAERSNGLIARSLIEAVSQSLSEMDEAVDAGNFDLFDVEHWASLIRAHDRTMRDVTCLLKYERRQSNEITAVKEAQSQTEDRLQERKQWFTDYECDDLLQAEHWGDER